MDNVLQQLQGKSFHLPSQAFNFLSKRYDKLIQKPLMDIMVRNEFSLNAKFFINPHRKQLQSEEYVQSRIDDNSGGTLDHLHAEVVSSTAYMIAVTYKCSPYELFLAQVAGHLHDIDRSFPVLRSKGEVEARGNKEEYIKYKETHAQYSCNRTKEIYYQLKSQGIVMPIEVLDDLCYIIKLHELGGHRVKNELVMYRSGVDPTVNLNQIADIVMTADSLGYLDSNILTNWEETGKNEQLIKNKVHYMYDRLRMPGKILAINQIVESKIHILGVNCPQQEDLQAIRAILRKVCIK